MTCKHARLQQPFSAVSGLRKGR